MYHDIPDELRTLIEPIVDGHGCELMDVDVVRGGGAAVFRVTIDSSRGDGRVPVECCALVSREIEAQLDATGAMNGSYRLEVSSPGLDRILAREKDFAAARGAEVKLQTRRPLDGRRRFKGVLLDINEGIVRIEVDGVDTAIPFDDIEKANTVYKFSRADFASREAS